MPATVEMGWPFDPSPRCAHYPRILFYCGAIFRNPAGTFAQKNEYLIIQRFGRFEFAVAK